MSAEYTMEMDNRPLTCSKCGSVMIFKGLGTYRCEKCNHEMKDDYGKVREFLEKMPGASIIHVSDSTGVSTRSIQQMLKDARIQITKDTKDYLHCEACGVSIKYGRLCPKCEMAAHRERERKLRYERNERNMMGTSNVKSADSGAIRFGHDD